MGIDSQLDTLENRGLIGVATYQPEIEYLFRHALVQDAAYESLLKQERRQLHRTVGEVLEQLYPERRAELAAILARHYEQAGASEQAIEYLIEAARYAYQRNAVVESYDLYTRARALLPDPSPSDAPELRRRLVEIDLGRVKSGFSFLGEEGALQLLDSLLDEADQLADAALAGEVHLHSILLRQLLGQRPKESPRLQHSLDRVTEISEELGDPTMAAVAHSLIGMVQVVTGDIAEGVERLREAAPQLEQRLDFIGSSFALQMLAVGLARLGRFDEAFAFLQRASEVAAQGDVIARLDALIGESEVRALRGDLSAAEPIALECTELAQQSGATACLVASTVVLGDVLARQGRHGDARAALERGRQIADLTEQKLFRPSIAAYLRAAAAKLGDFGPDARTFDEALDETRAMHDRWGEAHVLWKRAETEVVRAARAGEPPGEPSLADFAAAARSLEQMAARPVLARLLRQWGHALRDAGRPDEGDDRLRRAIELLDEVGIEREANEVRAELGA
jgi:tetratricopeptide (TPR) repeat protein